MIPIPETSNIIHLIATAPTALLPETARITVKDYDILEVQNYREKTGWEIEMAPVNAGLQISLRAGTDEPAIKRALKLAVDLYDDDFAKELLSHPDFAPIAETVDCAVRFIL